MMLTFTIDPQLFESPEAAFDFCHDKRAIAATLKRLHRWGVLPSNSYFCAVEWQKESELPHFHVLVEAHYLDIWRVREAWNMNYKGWEDRVAMGRPGLGGVKFSKRDFASPEHAARYATKYIIKTPEHGYPAWVMGRHSIHRYSISQGLWSSEAGGEASAASLDGIPTPDWVNETPQDPNAAEASPEAGKRQRRMSIAEKLARCGESCNLYEVERIDRESGEMLCPPKRRFIDRLSIPFAELLAEAARVGIPLSIGGKVRQYVRLASAGAVGKLRQAIGLGLSTLKAGITPSDLAGSYSHLDDGTRKIVDALFGAPAPSSLVYE